MPTTAPGEPLAFRSGHTTRNRLMLAPLTNTQSNDDGSLSQDELRWLRMRAEGGFGIVTTCATSIRPDGRCWPGQLGLHPAHVDDHRRIAEAVHDRGALSLVQLHHGGMRADREQNGGVQPVSASDVERHDARALTTDEVAEVRDDFVAAAVRAQEAGHDGVQLHGAHGYLLAQFLSPTLNERDDRYGGDADGRSLLLRETIDGVRDACGDAFLLSVRLTLERFGIELDEGLALAQRLLDERRVDLLDLSLWDVDKPSGRGERTMLDEVADLMPGDTALTVAGNVRDGAAVQRVLDAGVHVATIGRAAIVHHDFAARVLDDPGFVPIPNPVTADHLRAEGLGEDFVAYMRSWDGFVTED